MFIGFCLTYQAGLNVKVILNSNDETIIGVSAVSNVFHNWFANFVLWIAQQVEDGVSGSNVVKPISVVQAQHQAVLVWSFVPCINVAVTEGRAFTLIHADFIDRRVSGARADCLLGNVLAYLQLVHVIRVVPSSSDYVRSIACDQRR